MDDAAFAASPKLLTPSSLRPDDRAPLFPAPAAPASVYRPPTGALALPSLLALTAADVAALPDCVEWFPAAPGCAEAIVVGTAHVSAECVDEVRDSIAALRPDVVLLEICQGRAQLLERMEIGSTPTLEQMLEQIKGGADLFSVVYPWFLSTIAAGLEVTPGAEFRSAFLAASALSEGGELHGESEGGGPPTIVGRMGPEDAQQRTKAAAVAADTAYPPRSEDEVPREQQIWLALHNARAACKCPIVLGDRHISATVNRVWGALTPWDRVCLIGSFILSGFSLDAEEVSVSRHDLAGIWVAFFSRCQRYRCGQEYMDGVRGKEGRDVLVQAVREMGEEYPAFTGVLLDERDEWLAQQLFTVCRNDVIERIDAQGGVAPPWPRRVVAVVGAGHAPGMREYWESAAVGRGPRTDLVGAFSPFPERP